MKCSYHPGYQIVRPPDPPAGGVPPGGTAPAYPAPIATLPVLRDRLLAEAIIEPADLLRPEPLGRETLALVHTDEYLDKLESSALTPAEQRRLGMRWSDSLWFRSRLVAGGTLLAAREALNSGLTGNLAGGTHHAFADHGEGFCVINDVAIAIRQLRREHAIGRALIIDLDVHQGNGSAAIFEGDAAVFTFSMHAERNYPSAKMRSSLDVGLPDGAGDEAYLDALAAHLPDVLRPPAPDIAFYLAGVDVAAGDRYGRLMLSDEGIRARERLVIESVRSRQIPLVILLAGGYASTRERTAELHAHAFREGVLYERSHRDRGGPPRDPGPNLRPPSTP